MKKINKFKVVFSLFFCSCLVATPMLVFSSCHINEKNIVQSTTFKNLLQIESTQPITFKTNSYKCDELLYGSNSICNGNYVLFISSNTDNVWSSYDGWNIGVSYEQWKENFNDSPIDDSLKTLTNCELKQDLEDVALLFYFDIRDPESKIIDHKGNQIDVCKDDKHLLQNIGPFDKWNEQWFRNTYDYYHKNNNNVWISSDDKNESEFSSSSYHDQYIRYDESAINFRKFIERGQLLYPKIDKERTSTFSDSSLSYLVFFKDGKLEKLNLVNKFDPKDLIDNFDTIYCEKK